MIMLTKFPVFRMSTVFLSRLDPSWGEVWLKKTLEEYGRVINLDIPIHRNGARKGVAFVQYATNEEALAAIKALSTFRF